MKTLYLESIAGIAGDMFTAGFLDAGLVTLDTLQHLCDQLGLPEVEIIASEVIRSTMRGTHLDVCQENLKPEQLPAFYHHGSHVHSQEHMHVPYQALDQYILQSDLADNTKLLARKIFNTLAEAEAHCHGVIKEEVEFHEVGMIDSLIDVVMAAHCINMVNPDKIIASPVKPGRGFIQTAHGYLPVPPPVSAALLVNMQTASIPSVISQENVELSTPTGLAILKTLQPCFSNEWPGANVLAQGYGAGTRDLATFPNLFRVCLLETETEMSQQQVLPYLQDRVIEITANFDDYSPESLAWAGEQLFECGAVDVWQTPVTGKKGRVMIVLSVLSPLSRWQQCVNFILKNTSTFGLRYRQMDRFYLTRHFENRSNGQGSFRVKIGSDTTGQVLKEKCEFEDMRTLWQKG